MDKSYWAQMAFLLNTSPNCTVEVQFKHVCETKSETLHGCLGQYPLHVSGRANGGFFSVAFFSVRLK